MYILCVIESFESITKHMDEYQCKWIYLLHLSGMEWGLGFPATLGGSHWSGQTASVANKPISE